jgi:L-asparaginase
MKKRILLITLGGTIDSDPYSEVPGEYPPNATPNGKQLARTVLRSMVGDRFDVEHIEICDLDSKDVKPEHIEKLWKILNEQAGDYDRVIVTCGTDRMVEYASNIAYCMLPNPPVPVVFTGSIWPLSNGNHSDGYLNLAQAALAHMNAVPDVYIAMNRLFEHCIGVRKNVKEKVFEKFANLKRSFAPPQPA